MSHPGVRLSLALLLLLGSVLPARSATDQRFVTWHGEHGPVLSIIQEAAPPGPQPQPPRESWPLWHRYIPDPIYTTAGLSLATMKVFAGNYLNPPEQVETIAVTGNGTPEWVYPGQEFYVDSARGADVLAALDAGADSTVTVQEWRAGASAPLWSYPVHPGRPLTGEGWSAGKGIQVSDDGSTIAAVVNMYAPGGLNATLYVFNAGSPVPATVYPLPDGTASALAVTPGGEFIAVYAWPYIYVWDRYANALRWSGSAGSGNDALAISGDGSFLAWGWSSLTLRQWNGTAYQQVWSRSFPNYYVGECAMSPDNQSLAVGWYRNTVDENIIEMYGLPAHDLVWTYNYGVSRPASPPAPATTLRDPTEIISEMVFSQDSRYLAAASWGSTFPEIHAFERSNSVPLLEEDTPGSMFDIDIVTGPGGDAYLVACGKHVHAGISGRGADLYAFGLSEGLSIEDAAVSAVLSAARPNPFDAGTRIEFRLAQSAPARLTVHDAQGRLLARLLGQERDAGLHSITWDGTDDAGRMLPAGVYYVRLTAGEETSARRIVRMR